MPTPIGVLLDEGDGDHAPDNASPSANWARTWPPASRERDASTRDLVCAGDDLSLVARLRVDEQEEHGVASVPVDAEQSVGCGRASSGARVGGSARSHSDRDESNAIAEQPLSIAPLGVIEPVPVIPATRTSPAAA